MAAQCCVGCVDGTGCERTIDRGVLTEGSSCQLVDGSVVTVMVPNNIPSDRPVRVWIVRPSKSHAWIVGGRL